MKRKYIISIDLGGTNIKAALLSRDFHILHKETFPTPASSGKKTVINALVSASKDIIRNHGISVVDILGVGIGVPGPVDFYGQVVHFLPNIPGWKKVALSSIYTSYSGIPCVVDNDAKLMCLAEYRLGAASGSRNAVCLTLGTGVGAGIIIDGRLYRGADNAAGEIGHMPLNENGPDCPCGGQACLERYVGNNALIRHARSVFGREVSLEELSSLASSGDGKAKEFWRKTAEQLSVNLVGLTNALNPDVIVIGGGVANAGKVLFDEIKSCIHRRAMSVQGKRVKVFKAKLGNDAGLIGAAIMAVKGAEV